MKVEYFDSKLNFGDELNSWLWAYFIKDIDKVNKFETLVPVGSLLCDWFLDRVENKKTVIFSSGAGYGDVANLKNSNISIIGVRGKLTAKVLGLDENLAIGDGAALISLVPELRYSKSSGVNDKPIIFIPHHESLEDYDWASICKEIGVVFIDPRNTSKFVAENIINSRLVIAEAMHGAIFADALRVPWVPIVTNHRINTFKWMDWLSMYELQYDPIYTGTPSFLLELENKIRIGSNTSLYSKKNDISYFSDNMFSDNLKLKIKRKVCSVLCKVIRVAYNTLPKKKGLYHNRVIQNMTYAKNHSGYLSNDKLFANRVNNLFEKINTIND